MRPREIDFESRLPHYFDLVTGEILAGVKQLNRHLKTADDFEAVRPIGEVLRELPEDAPRKSYDRVDYTDWEERKLKAYGKWIAAFVDPPEDNAFRQLSGSVLQNANRMGIGPGIGTLKTEFDSLTNFYVAIGESRANLHGQFDDWQIDDFVAYLRKLGNGRRPTKEQIDEASRKSTYSPSRNQIMNRYQNIGGLGTLLELAGYPIVERWDPNDFIEWGIRFMRANDGTVPTSRMLMYLATKDLGPSTSAVRGNFDKLSKYQMEVSKEYYARKKQADEITRMLELEIDHGLTSGNLPSSLFNDARDSSDTLELYAKYLVIEALVPRIEPERRVELCCDTVTIAELLKELKKYELIDIVDIEHAATIANVYDILWPHDQKFIDMLKLDDGFQEVMRANREYAAKWEKKNAEKKKLHNLFKQGVLFATIIELE